MKEILLLKATVVISAQDASYISGILFANRTGIKKAREAFRAFSPRMKSLQARDIARLLVGYRARTEWGRLYGWAAANELAPLGKMKKR